MGGCASNIDSKEKITIKPKSISPPVQVFTEPNHRVERENSEKELEEPVKILLRQKKSPKIFTFDKSAKILRRR
jgi:hypothetical protein